MNAGRCHETHSDGFFNIYYAAVSVKVVNKYVKKLS